MSWGVTVMVSKQGFMSLWALGFTNWIEALIIITMQVLVMVWVYNDDA